jgi:2-polyprenyl-3-methyl-5-hydroxy-6-metoxy-1,4-benzoquinol methylase
MRNTQDTVDIGHATLRRMASAGHYNSWIFRLFQPYVGDRVVEVGCGIGNMTRYFLGAQRVVAFDLLPEAVQLVRKMYREATNLTAMQGDVCDVDIVRAIAPLRPDTVVSINMLEHVRRDDLALGNMHALLEPGGHLLLFVPAGAYLYGSLDVALGHYRRYERAQLRDLVQAAGFTVVKLHYVNALGVAGWWLNSCVLRRRILPKSQLRAFNRVIRVMARIERRCIPPFGQSLLCIARKG